MPLISWLISLSVQEIKISNLSDQIVEGTLEQIFGQFGTITCWTKESGQTAIIKYRFGHSAKQAVNYWHKKIIQGQRVNVILIHDVMLDWDPEVYYSALDAKKNDRPIVSL